MKTEKKRADNLDVLKRRLEDDLQRAIGGPQWNSPSRLLAARIAQFLAIRSSDYSAESKRFAIEYLKERIDAGLWKAIEDRTLDAFGRALKERPRPTIRVNQDRFKVFSAYLAFLEREGRVPMFCELRESLGLVVNSKLDAEAKAKLENKAGTFRFILKDYQLTPDPNRRPRNSRH